MLALHQAEATRESVLAYFDATYDFRDPAVQRAFRAFLRDEQEGMFRGPFLDIRLPYAKAAKGARLLEIEPDFDLYHHQRATFERLATRNGQPPEPTILTTGTGSGKTESFLYPILDYCAQHRDRPGIKAIILYPMNALATDQAQRIAEAIWEVPALRKQNITAGLLIGAGKQAADYSTTMQRDRIIENRDTILASPPDILLTNFKMLDYALMRSRYQRLWNLNRERPELLRFLVLDELHTYDGAQGTDVANLIRRLKLKLRLPAGQLCPVGTSATVGSGEDGVELLAEYATKVFGEKITADCIVGEKRETVTDFFGEDEENLSGLPPRLSPAELRYSDGDSPTSYLRRQNRIWLGKENADVADISDYLRQSGLLRAVIDRCSAGPVHLTDMCRHLGREYPAFSRLATETQQDLLRSLVGLVDRAADTTGRPLLTVQVQLWIREVSGIVRRLAPEPAFEWRTPGRTPGDTPGAALPIWHCRECGAGGWLTVKPDNQEKITDDARQIFGHYFSNHKNIWWLNLDTPANQPAPDYAPTDRFRRYLDPETLHLYSEDRPGRLAVLGLRKFSGIHGSDHTCPSCNSQRRSVSIVGGRVPVIASVVAGQLMASDFDSTPTSQRKLLAFTNAVQDAAHQAGFIASRDYRFSFRTALKTVLDFHQKPFSLAELAEQFEQYWRIKLSDDYRDQIDTAYVARFFPAKKIGKVDPEDYRDEQGHYLPDFVAELRRAIASEIWLEFGLRSTVGRTLEKFGAAGIALVDAPLATVYPEMQDWLRENQMASITRPAFRAFLTGLLLRMRRRGAIDSPFLAKYRGERATLWNLNWTRDGRHFLNPTYGPHTPGPKPVATERLDDRSGLDTTETQVDNWFHAYFRQCFELVADSPAAINEFYQVLFPALVAAGVCDEVAGKEATNYTLRPANLRVESRVVTYQCSTCGSLQSVAATHAEQLAGVPCIARYCSGRYERTTVATDGYYRQVFGRKDAHRIYATDHTGLLDRQDRENKEKDFKTRPRPDSYNLLIATSTLEMGIDIGDLNVGINTAVPPLPANFLQRVGRAGRKSGTAYIVNLAGANQPHDLYYFQEPSEMMSGVVNTPGCFLEAREILRRHFLAFVIDRWSEADPDRHTVPSTLGKLNLGTAQQQDNAEWFPNRLMDYLADQGTALLETFQSGYRNDATGEGPFLEIAEQLAAGHLERRWLTCFREVVGEYRNLQQMNQQLAQRLEKLDRQDPDYQRIKRQMSNVKGGLRQLRERQTLEHLTNYGLLPNYAFPETGVTLTARVTSRTGGAADAEPEYRSEDIEVTRPAKRAIKEMVPGRFFYTQGRRLPIEGINTADFDQLIAEYRFCGNCDHLAESDSIPEGTPCPKCDHLSFGAPQNQHHIFRLRNVQSHTRRDLATVDDSREEREKPRQSVLRHFDFTQSRLEGAIVLKDIPFGVEHHTGVYLREVNTGPAEDPDNPPRIDIAEHKVSARGFVTCQICGKTCTHTRKEDDWRTPKEAADYHYPYCRARDHRYENEEDDVFREVYFYREMRSEVLKILVPVQELDTEEQIAMLMSGLNLGLRHYYGGNPQHLDLYEYWEYNPHTQRKDRYLIVVDNIPGGTGYLSKLFRQEELSRLLQLAYARIRDCNCQHRGKDGCYHCVFAYETQHFQHELSRAQSEELFRRIVAASDDWEVAPQGLSRLQQTSKIEESELEIRFVKLFRTLARRQPEVWNIEELNEGGVIEYRITYTGAKASYVYRLRPQVELARRHGVSYSMRADFVLSLAGGSRQGQPLANTEIEAVPRIIIETDGYQFHATAQNPRFPIDVVRRHALIGTDRYLSWTLTYADVELAEREEAPKTEGESRDELAKAFQQAQEPRAMLLSAHQGKWLASFARAEHSFGRLVWWLEQGLDREKLRGCTQFYLACLQTAIGQDNYVAREVDQMITGRATPAAFRALSKLDASAIMLLNAVPPFTTNRFSALLFASVTKLELTFRLTAASERDLEAGFTRENWQLFWRLFNLLQLVGDSPPELDQIGNGLGAQLTLVQAAIAAPESRPASEAGVPLTAADEVLEYYDEEYHELVRTLLDRRVDFEREGSYIVNDDKNVTIAEAVLGLPDYGLVFGPLDEASEKYFQAEGMRVLTPAEFSIEMIHE